MPHPVAVIRQLFNLSNDEESALLAMIEERCFGRGELIEARSMMRTYGYYVCSGMARVFFMRKGRDHTYSFALENEYIMMSHLLLTEPDEVVCIEFLEPTTVMFLPHRQLEVNLDALRPGHAREVLRFVISAMAHQLRRLEERMIMLQTATATERYHWMEQCYPRVLERAKMSQVASFLGITKETLYRIRSKKYPCE